MTLALYITPRAARDIERVNAWWGKNRPDAPDAVADDLERTLSLLRAQPGIGASVALAQGSGVRRVHLERIRYYVYFRVRESRLEVLCVWHSSRGREPRL